MITVSVYIGFKRPIKKDQRLMNYVFQHYNDKLHHALTAIDSACCEKLTQDIQDAWHEDRQILICGNGGSAANALHWANDLVFGLACGSGKSGMKALALPANQAVMTCLGNDIGYENVYQEQVRVYGKQGDILLVMSGSGNSPNILNALSEAKDKGMRTHGIFGFDGGHGLNMVDNVIHIAVDDMQIAEDAQIILGHFITRKIRLNMGLENH